MRLRTVFHVHFKSFAVIMLIDFKSAEVICVALQTFNMIFVKQKAEENGWMVHLRTEPILLRFTRLPRFKQLIHRWKLHFFKSKSTQRHVIKRFQLQLTKGKD